MSSPLSGALPAEPSAQLQTAIDFLTLFCNKDLEKLSTLLTDDYIHYLLPKSLGSPPCGKVAWVKQMQEALRTVDHFKVQL